LTTKDLVAFQCRQCLYRRIVPEGSEYIEEGLCGDCINGGFRSETKRNHKRVLVEEIAKAGGVIEPTELYERYRAAVDDPRSDRQVRNYLAELEDEGQLLRRGRTRNRSVELT
jgi:hypothetical protein